MDGFGHNRNHFGVVFLRQSKDGGKTVLYCTKQLTKMKYYCNFWSNGWILTENSDSDDDRGKKQCKKEFSKSDDDISATYDCTNCHKGELKRKTHGILCLKTYWLKPTEMAHP